MKHNFFKALGIALLLGSSLFAGWNNNASVPAGCQHLTFNSKANNTTIGYVVYLPPKYNTETTTRYPVLYSFHGMGGNEGSNTQIATTLQSLINANTVKPYIIVFVCGRENTFYADSKDGTVKCETSIISELIPHVDSLFRTIPDREHRATHGFSMGGFGALCYAFKHFNMFSSVTTNCAALVTWDTLRDQTFDKSIPNQIFGADANYFNNNYYPPTFVNKNADTLKKLNMRVRITENPGDVTMGPLYAYNRSMWNLLKSKGIYVEVDSAAGSGHAPVYTGTSAENMLKFISANFAAATPVTSPVQAPALHSVNATMSARAITMGEFAIPQEWHATSKEVAVFSVLGKQVGRESIEGRTTLDGNSLANRFGSSMIFVKPLVETK